MSNAERCVYCRQRRVDPLRRPFCSDRCRMADLGRWLGGEYRVAEPTADDGATDAARAVNGRATADGDGPDEHL